MFENCPSSMFCMCIHHLFLFMFEARSRSHRDTNIIYVKNSHILADCQAKRINVDWMKSELNWSKSNNRERERGKYNVFRSKQNQKRNHHICTAEKAIKHKITIAKHRHHWNPFRFFGRKQQPRLFFVLFYFRPITKYIYKKKERIKKRKRQRDPITKQKLKQTKQDKRHTHTHTHNKIAACMICHGIYVTAKQFKWHHTRTVYCICKYIYPSLDGIWPAEKWKLEMRISLF